MNQRGFLAGGLLFSGSTQWHRAIADFPAPIESHHVRNQPSPAAAETMEEAQGFC
jgi:hypothetical protein